MKIGYARVSTKDQTLAAQIDALNLAGCEKVFEEKLSGKRRKRPELGKLLEHVRPDDVVVVTKLDRLARSLSDFIGIMAELKSLDVGFISLGENFDLSSPAGRMQMGIFAVIAEFERELISQRTKDGLEAARRRGRVGGRKPVLNDIQKKEVFERVERGDLTQKEVAAIYKVSLATVKRVMKAGRGL